MSDDDDRCYVIVVTDSDKEIYRSKARGIVERDVLIAKWRESCPLCAIDARPDRRSGSDQS